MAESTSVLRHAALSERDQRGTLHYMGIDGRGGRVPQVLVGTFRLNPSQYTDGSSGVTARRRGGRNTWHLCNVADVVEFRLNEGWS